jgi:hypothetical protein
MPIFGLIPHVSGDRQELRAAASPLLWVICLNFIQIGLMVAVTILFVERTDLASAFYDGFKWFTAYIPFLSRYGDWLVRANRLDEFKEIFAIFCGYLLLECAFLLASTAILFRHIDFRMSNPFGNRRRVILLLLAVALGTLVFFLVGDVDVKSSRLVRGDYFFGLFDYCVALPGVNILAGLIIYAEFGRPMRGIVRKAILDRAGNYDTIDRPS